jgi:hypothetical protein
MFRPPSAWIVNSVLNLDWTWKNEYRLDLRKWILIALEKKNKNYNKIQIWNVVCTSFQKDATHIIIQKPLIVVVAIY